MKADNKLSLLTVEELKEKYKKTKSVATVLGIFMFVSVGLLIYMSIKTENYALIAVGFGSAVTMLPIWASLKEIEKELKSRNASL